MEQEKFSKTEFPKAHFSKLSRDVQIRMHTDYLDAIKMILEKINYYNDYINEFAKMKDIHASQVEKNKNTPCDNSTKNQIKKLESAIQKVEPKINGMKDDIVSVIEEYKICEDTINTLSTYILETQDMGTEKVLTNKVKIMDNSEHIDGL